MPVVQSSKQGKGLEIRERFHVSVKKLSIFKSHKMLLAVRGDKGIHMISGPPDYNVTDAFQHDSAKNCKVSLAEFVRNGCLNVQITLGLLAPLYKYANLLLTSFKNPLPIPQILKQVVSLSCLILNQDVLYFTAR